MSIDVIDVWMQHPTQRFLQQPFFASLWRWTGVNAASGVPDIPLEATLAGMDHAGISTGLIAAWHGPQGDLISNDEVADIVSQHPGRFAGLASVDLNQPMQAVRELRRRVREQGFKGLRIVPWLWNLPPNDRRYYPLYAECCELQVPFCTQIGHTGPLMPSEPGRPIPYLEQVALDFPELKIVAGHVGAPWTSEAILLARKFENVWLDTSAYKASRYPTELVAYMQSSACSRVMFGSNYPMLTAAACLKDLTSLGLSADAEAAFLHGNARAVFKLQ